MMRLRSEGEVRMPYGQVYNPGSVNLAAQMRMAEKKADENLLRHFPIENLELERTRMVRKEFESRCYP
jgi:hypothetical protein